MHCIQRDSTYRMMKTQITSRRMDGWFDDDVPESHYERKQVGRFSNRSAFFRDNVVQQKQFNARARTEDCLALKWHTGGSAQKRWSSKFWRRPTNGYRSHCFANRIDRESLDSISQELVLQPEVRHRLVGYDNSCKGWITAIDNCASAADVCQKKSSSPRHRKFSFFRRFQWKDDVRRTITLNLDPRTRTLTAAFLPDCIRKPNRLAKEWLQMIAFAPIFMSHAVGFAEQHVMHRLRMAISNCSLTYQLSNIRNSFSLGSRNGSALELSWSNGFATQRRHSDEQPGTQCLNWKRLELDQSRYGCHGFKDCGRCKPYCRHNGCLIFCLQRQMRQLWHCSSLLTKMAIDVRIPRLWRPSKGCQAALCAHLAVALACSNHQAGWSAKAVMGMTCCILRRAFNVKRKLQMMAQVAHACSVLGHLAQLTNFNPRCTAFPSCSTHRTMAATAATPLPHLGQHQHDFHQLSRCCDGGTLR
jgi:hypothetical protein